MKISISGSRSIKNKQTVYIWLDTVIKLYDLKPTQLHSGNAQGVDRLAERYFAERYGIIPTIYKPNYEMYGRYAPLRRNVDIIKDTDTLIVIHDGHSKGTLDAMRKGDGYGIPIIYINVPEGTHKLIKGISRECLLPF